MEERRILMATLDNETYKERRDIFLNELAIFKSGGIANGVNALNHLYQMYFIKPMILHIKLNKQESENFITKIDELRKELVFYMQDHSNEKGNMLVNDTTYYMKLDAKMDEIIEMFYLIMAEVKCL